LRNSEEIAHFQQRLYSTCYFFEHLKEIYNESFVFNIIKSN
jgi:hypothetical protein